MTVDTTYSPELSDEAKTVAQQSFERTQDHLATYNINLVVDDDPRTELRYNDMTGILRDVAHLNVTEDTTADPLMEQYPLVKTERDSALYDEARDELTYYAISLTNKDSLNANGITYRGQDQYEVINEALSTHGYMDYNTNVAHVNLPSIIKSAYEQADQATGLTRKQLIQRINVVTTHELGHDAGLVHPRLFGVQAGDNVMAHKNHKHISPDLSPIQAYLWKTGLTPGTKLYNARQEASEQHTIAPIHDVYYDYDIDPADYLGDDDTSYREATTLPLEQLR
jgi:hypothetical protein